LFLSLVEWVMLWFSLVVLSSLALAAEQAPAFFGELVLLIVASAAIAFISFRVGLVPIVSFLLAGVLIGPGALGLIKNPEVINAAAEIGVVLLLFTIGIEFSLDRLARIGRLIFVGGGLQVGLTLAITTGVLTLAGVDWHNAVFTGCLLALSSTAIVMKLLSDRSETNSPAGQASLGILIFQDLAVVAMVLVVPMLGSGGGGGLAIVWAFVKATAIIAVVLTLARWAVPRFLEAVAKTCSREVFLLVVIGLCFGTAYVTSLAGLSLALGAFLAGLLVSESRFGQQALGEILPLQILFSAAFFVSVGLLFNVGFLLANLGIIAAALAAVLVLKTAVTAFSTKVLGYSAGISWQVGLLLAQVGEFSFVLERTGREAGLLAFGSTVGSDTFTALTVILMAATPLLASLGARVEAKQPTDNSPQTPAIPTHGFDLSNHAILAGYGSRAKKLAFALKSADIPFVVLTLSPDGGREAESLGYPVLQGDYANTHILDLAGLNQARLLVVADDDPSMAHRVASVVKSRAEATIVAFSAAEADREHLEHAGAFVITAEEHSHRALLQHVLGHFGNANQEHLEQALMASPASLASENPVPKTPTQNLALSPEEIARGRCSHTDWAKPLSIDTDTHVCPECVALGDTWVHLRVCMTCGHVGCCNDSKNKHAQHHFNSTGHPIIKSLEPGDTWSWCYVDKTIL
jgi:monovalent cation:H+ antiporter-2, CPA2 family